jgi:ATP-dependent Clp protease adaptor protein ClpS
MRMSEPDVIVKPKARTRVARPKLYRVVLLNDDFTPREFVCLVLRGVFRLPPPQAERVMLTAHQQGACVVAVYTKEIAETKAAQAHALAAEHGHPLAFRVEPED